jgi:Mn-dependent DtxR family transcriptional regulator
MNNHGSASLSLTPDQLRQLNGTEMIVLEVIYDMCLRQTGRSPTGAAYCYPGQGWIAKRIGKSREWVNRCLQKLCRMGLLQSQRRRKVRGMWQTCLYKLGTVLLTLLRSPKSLIHALLHRVKYTSHIVKKPSLVRENSGLKRAFKEPRAGPNLEELISRLGKKIEEGG